MANMCTSLLFCKLFTPSTQTHMQSIIERIILHVESVSYMVVSSIEIHMTWKYRHIGLKTIKRFKIDASISNRFIVFKPMCWCFLRWNISSQRLLSTDGCISNSLHVTVRYLFCSEKNILHPLRNFYCMFASMLAKPMLHRFENVRKLMIFPGEWPKNWCFFRVNGLKIKPIPCYLGHSLHFWRKAGLKLKSIFLRNVSK